MLEYPVSSGWMKRSNGGNELYERRGVLFFRRSMHWWSLAILVVTMASLMLYIMEKEAVQQRRSAMTNLVHRFWAKGLHRFRWGCSHKCCNSDLCNDGDALPMVSTFLLLACALVTIYRWVKVSAIKVMILFIESLVQVLTWVKTLLWKKTFH